MQTELFSSPSVSRNASFEEIPLAHKIRPQDFKDFVGQKHIFKRYPFLNGNGPLPGLIFYGPPGTGKTTLAYLLAKKSGRDFYKFNAVLGGLPELKKLIQSSIEMKKQLNVASIIFIDEIHRFNKAQQDALLPHLEEGNFILIGATTENPRSSLNKAILSRVQCLELKSLTEEDLLQIIRQTVQKGEMAITEEAILFLAKFGNGDARFVINILELAKQNQKENDLKIIELEQIQKEVMAQNRNYDRNNDRHYDVISAFIKSMRGSHPDAALLYLAIMLDGGEDPLFIARRMVIFASEDVGNADPKAITLATSILLGVKNIGMPEARILLAQGVTYLSSTLKSNASYKAINKAMEYVQSHQTISVPDHLKNFPPKESRYLYPHNYPKHFVFQKYTHEEVSFYSPTEEGVELHLKKRLSQLWPD